MSLPKELEKVLEITKAQNVWRRTQTLNLIASENVMSPLAESVYMSDFMSRYAEGKPYKRYYQGTKYTDEIETLTMELMNEITNSKDCDLRPTSGTIANAAVFRVLAEPGDKALIAPVQAGAHVSHTKFGTLGALGIQHIEMPFDEENINVDVDKAIKMIEEVKPKFVVLGGSLYLFPHPTKELAQHVHAVGAKLVYDAAHVYGLIEGKVWSNPLKDGADIMTVSTHKTFPGPQGGAIFSDGSEVFKQVSKTIFPWFVSNHHLHRLPATAVTAIEMKYFGESYANQILRNSKALAEALAERGFKVIGENLGYTKSHQVAVDVRQFGGGNKIAKLLEDANIIVNKNLLPYDKPEDVSDPSGLRIGVQEMTRYGMKEGEMEEIAELFKKVIIDKKDVNEVKKEVIEMRRNFLEVKYTFDDMKDLEKYSSKSLKLII
ncbi:serine hydroxymethyltransferase [Saccharolobus solfataricus]|uniref:Serine hydroxymethyltransferase n=3 Tax=Saccharolobus solfataricus TaxID=2287 RepID=GLYA_SACS2|nr:serine hydroxymethyltransferase [Saccharolobus solfataricus]Q9UWT5.1 RecName: Full=Serine hydroxymethyltransferase; Short=SHMT; Short=Serine methylase [Saccharolobus solfataricus P2]AAK40850.1 Serine hydroxymethyltransferase (glyA) [Saccharolobus solfataricus P2]AKA73892.1 serine hydroxymethyltransferase [Saccharolobus solfataricus]AKA76590.1 serine hydroxymethyltransferase [Saccharolobus solfataricus]AKA79283.1 serine hydroxymethyltransferase [Saccharolobus solfataricus]AZF68369.1 serine 